VSPSAVIALIAVVIAALALYNSWRTGKQSNDIQRRLVQIEQTRDHDRAIQSLKAALRPKLHSTQNINRRSKDYQLVIENSGQGTARNVKAFLDGKPLLEHPALPGGMQEVSLIGSGSGISYPLFIAMGGPRPPFEFMVTWDDDSGEPGRYSTTLTF